MTMTQSPDREEDEELAQQAVLTASEAGRSRRPSSSCSSRCQRRHPRLFSRFVWIYLFLEGLCFLTDIAFLSSTIMAARRNVSANTANPNTNTNTNHPRARFLRRAQDDDDNNNVVLLEALQAKPAQSAVQTVPEEIPLDPVDPVVVAFDWKTFQALFLQQLKLQWQQQQDFLEHWFSITITTTATTTATHQE